MSWHSNRHSRAKHANQLGIISLNILSDAHLGVTVMGVTSYWEIMTSIICCIRDCTKMQFVCRDWKRKHFRETDESFNRKWMFLISLQVYHLFSFIVVPRFGSLVQFTENVLWLNDGNSSDATKQWHCKQPQTHHFHTGPTTGFGAVQWK